MKQKVLSKESALTVDEQKVLLLDRIRDQGEKVQEVKQSWQDAKDLLSQARKEYDSEIDQLCKLICTPVEPLFGPGDVDESDDAVDESSDGSGEGASA